MKLPSQRKLRKSAAKSLEQSRQNAADSPVRAQLQEKLDLAAATTDKLAQETALMGAVEAAEAHDGPRDRRWKEWLDQRMAQMQDSGALVRGEWLGHVAHVQLFTDRVVFAEDGRLFVEDVDEHLSASLQTAGEITARPTLTRMAIGSVLPGTALIPGLAFQKRSDNRQLFFVLEHPRWCKIVELDPDAFSTANSLRVKVNQVAAKAGHDREEPSPVEAETPAEDVAQATSTRYLDELERLGALKDSGLLTAEEFDAQKARILGSTAGEAAPAARRPSAGFKRMRKSD